MGQTRSNRFLLVVGGARSGKSDFALAQGLASDGPVMFIATAVVPDDDADLAARVSKHRAERPPEWGLLETPVELAAAIDGLDEAGHQGGGGAGDGSEHLLIIDCLTVWTSNLLFEGWAEPEVLAAAAAVADRLASRSGRSIVVSNEVGLGVHPTTELGRRYRDLLGRVNRVMADAADRSFFFSAGRAFELHDPAELLEREA